MFFLYILQSKTDGSYYIGSCENITTRLLLHNQGKVRSTKRGSPWMLVYQESFTTRSEAYAREQQIKSWKKRAAIEKLIKHF
ncbi:MAG: GIY-YIG nuclease family protein [Patescibacteria group bacterium]